MNKMKYAIKELTDNGRKTVVHADHPFMDCTLCGLALEGMGRDSNNEHEAAKETKSKINCGQCLQLIRHCKTLNP